jgi:hypothetical protein
MNPNVKIITILFFVIALLEVVTEALGIKKLLFIIKPLLPLLLIFLYHYESIKRDKIFYFVMFLSLITNLLFIPDHPKYLFYGILVFTLFRIMTIYLLIIHLKSKDYIAILIATIPFLLIFFYILSETPSIPEESYYVIFFQNFLISIFSGIALASYVLKDNKQNSVLMISAMLFMLLQIVVFIEKYFLVNMYQSILRPLAMSLNVLAFFSFYKFVVISEKLDKD